MFIIIYNFESDHAVISKSRDGFIELFDDQVNAEKEARKNIDGVEYFDFRISLVL